MSEYVLGFMFSEERDRVALIRKNKPDWQKGRLNGIGGKVEDESKYLAMAREFKEECGYETDPKRWNYYCRMAGTTEDGLNKFECHCFVTVGDLSQCKTIEDEQIEVVNIHDLGNYPLIENLGWLIHLALDYLEDFRPTFTLVGYGVGPHDELTSLRSKLSELEKNLKKTEEGLVSWQRIVNECERLSNCPDACYEPILSNLPNIVRDLVSDKSSLEQENKRLESRIKEEAQIIAGATAESNFLLHGELERVNAELSTLRANLKDAVEALEPLAKLSDAIDYAGTQGTLVPLVQIEFGGEKLAHLSLHHCRRAKETLQRLKEGITPSTSFGSDRSIPDVPCP